MKKRNRISLLIFLLIVHSILGIFYDSIRHRYDHLQYNKKALPLLFVNQIATTSRNQHTRIGGRDEHLRTIYTPCTFMNNCKRSPTKTKRNNIFLPIQLTRPCTILQLSTNQNDPFVDEADELFYYMNMFEQEEMEEDIDITYYNSSDNDDDMEDNDVIMDDMNDNHENDDDINNLIIPDLSTLLSSATKSVKTDRQQSNSTLPSSSSSTSLGLSKHIEQLAPAESIAYFYLQNTIGLSPDIMWKITLETGSVLGFTVQNLKEKIAFLKRIMNLSNEDIQIILTKQPSILHLSSNRNISQKVLFLVRALDLSKNDLREMILAYPCILCYSIPNLQKKIGFFQYVLGFDDEDVGSGNTDDLRKLLVQYPKLLIAAVDDSNYDDNNDDYDDEDYTTSYFSQSDKSNTRTRRGSGGLVGKFQFLHNEIGIPTEDLREIVKRNPSILLYSIQENLQPKLISLFIMRLRMDSLHICKVLKSFPNIIDYNMDDHLLPITRYFLSDLEFSPTEFRRIVLKFPKVYSLSLFKIKHVVGYLRYQLGMNASQVKRILFQAPQVISLNTDNTLVSKVEFMRNVFGLNQKQYNNDGMEDIRKVIAGMPTLLLCSVEKNLRPKAEYLLDKFGGDSLELRQAALTLPTLFGYSLEKRIKPRMNEILDAGIEPIKITVGITMTEVKFNLWLSNQRRRIENREKLIALNSIYDIESEENGIDEESDTDDKALRAIVLWNNNNDDDDRGKGRIMNWKR